MARRPPSTALVAAALWLPACSGGSASSDPVACSRAAVVYGDDGRIDVDRATTPWSALAASTTIALMRHTLVDPLLAGAPLDPSETALNALRLCPEERFTEEPVLAECSGMLLAPDLVLTAAHCFRGLGCHDMAFVGGYASGGTDGGAFGIDASRVRDCSTMLVPDTGDGSSPDAVLIRLDEPMPGASAPAVRREPMRLDETVVAVGFPSGLPMKIDEGRVVDARARERDYFGADVDTFGGSSGGPVLDSSGLLAGMVSTGQVDYVLDEARGCQRVNHASVDVDAGRYEHIDYLTTLLAQACRASVEEACNLLAPDTPSSGCR